MTLSELKKLVTYNPNTGLFVRNYKHRYKTFGTVITRKGSSHLRVLISGKYYYAHRLAWFYMTGKWPEDQIDHINGDGLDNRFSNLREATHSQNQINKSKRRGTTSKYKGVSWISSKRKYRAQISIDNTHYHLGYFTNELEAAQAYIRMARTLHKEFSNSEIIE